MKPVSLRPPFFSSPSSSPRKGKKKNRRQSSSDSITFDEESVSRPPNWTESSPGGSFTGGKITRRELEVVLSRLGPEEEVSAMLAEVGGNRSLRMDEIVALCNGVGGGHYAGTAEELKETFSVFDVNGDGRISAEELHAMLSHEGCTLDDCRRMIDGVDTDGDGYVSFEEFARMMAPKDNIVL